MLYRDNRDVFVSIITGSASSDSHVITLSFASFRFDFAVLFRFICTFCAAAAAVSFSFLHVLEHTISCVERKFFQSLFHCVPFDSVPFCSILLEMSICVDGMPRAAIRFSYTIPNQIIVLFEGARKNVVCYFAVSATLYILH